MTDKIDRNDPLAFICLRKYDAFQYTETGRPRKSGERRRWARLHLELLTSSDWTLATTDTKVLMITLILLATQYQNRVPNNREYLAHVSGVNRGDFDAAFDSLYGDGINGFCQLTNDATPEKEQTKVKRSTAKGTDTRFDEFWAVYPNRKDKKLARDRWANKDLDRIADKIIAAVKVQARSEDWTKNAGQFIPLPSTYLNRERWEDAETTVATPSRESMAHLGADGKPLST